MTLRHVLGATLLAAPFIVLFTWVVRTEGWKLFGLILLALAGVLMCVFGGLLLLAH